jgi:hypothetical protein
MAWISVCDMPFKYDDHRSTLWDYKHFVMLKHHLPNHRVYICIYITSEASSMENQSTWATVAATTKASNSWKWWKWGLGTASASHEKAWPVVHLHHRHLPFSPALWVEERVRTQGQNLNSRTTNRNFELTLKSCRVTLSSPGDLVSSSDGSDGSSWVLPSFLEFFAPPSSGLNKPVCPKL